MEIILGSLIFTVVILLLVLGLNAAEKRLVKTGNCRIIINNDEEHALQVPAGRTLLSTLADNKIFLPSACGGGGSCAMCKCQVLEGGGDVLLTEKPHLSRGEEKDHWRLSCQVKIKQDMRIHVPDEIFNIKKFHCRVKSNNNVATFIKELDMEILNGETLHFKSGGYIQIDIPEYHDLKYKNFDIQEKFRGDWDRFKMWDYTANNEEACFRAYSMANHPAEGNRIMLNVRIASPPPRTEGIAPGKASSYIFNLKPGDPVTVSGPYGEFFIKDTGREMVYIGGGAGMAPLRSHIFHLFHTLKTGRKVSFWYGARSMKEMFYDDEFKAIAEKFPNFKYYVALSEPLPEDNWTGPKGFIHQVVQDLYLKNHPDPGEVEYYLCGPPMMLSACKKMLHGFGVEPEMVAYDEFG